MGVRYSAGDVKDFFVGSGTSATKRDVIIFLAAIAGVDDWYVAGWWVMNYEASDEMVNAGVMVCKVFMEVVGFGWGGDDATRERRCDDVRECRGGRRRNAVAFEFI